MAGGGGAEKAARDAFQPSQEPFVPHTIMSRNHNFIGLLLKNCWSCIVRVEGLDRELRESCERAECVNV